MVNGVEFEYLEPKKEFRIGSFKNIAVPSNNLDDIKKMFPGAKTSESNADMLSQSFGSQPEITPIPSNQVVSSSSQNIAEPVQISGIPTTGASNLENVPASLDMNIPVLDTDVIKPTEIQQNLNDGNISQSIDNNNVIPNIDIPTMPNIDINALNTNQLNQHVSADSEFKVSTAPNIFDNPTSSFENKNEGDKPDENQISQSIIKEQDIVKQDLNDDIIEAEIAILENNIKHYEGLAENSRKKIELLKKQIKKDNNDVNLENTASNLFNKNGVLDDEQVLGETPMPTLRVA